MSCWRPRADSNRCKSFCRASPSLSVTGLFYINVIIFNTIFGYHIHTLKKSPFFNGEPELAMHLAVK